MNVPKSILCTTHSAILLAAMAIAGCASGPTYDDDTYAQPTCPRDYTMKCTKRSAQPERCSCVPTGHIEETVEALIGIN